MIVNTVPTVGVNPVVVGSASVAPPRSTVPVTLSWDAVPVPVPPPGAEVVTENVEPAARVTAPVLSVPAVVGVPVVPVPVPGRACCSGTP